MKKTPEEISKHFSQLGKASWKARKARLLKGEKLDKRTKKSPNKNSPQVSIDSTRTNE